MTNGERFAFYRKKNAMTQQQLATQLNVSAQAVSKWENDQSQPDIATLCKLAEIYQISMDELVGTEAKQQNTPQQQESTTVVAPVVMPVIVSGPKKGKKPNSAAQFLKKRWLVLVAALLALAAIIVVTVAVVAIVQGTEPARMLKKFEKIELGMTREEVEKIMGEPDATHETNSSGNNVNDALGELEYGYLGCSYWYYRDAQYDKMVTASEKAMEEWDLSYEPEPWTQIRLTFDKSGALIEAYYNATFKQELWNDYGVGTKTVQSSETIGEPPVIKGNYNTGYPSARTAMARIVFEDGSVYLGKIELGQTAQKVSGSDPAEGTVSFQHPWGTGEIALLWK